MGFLLAVIWILSVCLLSFVLYTRTKFIYSVFAEGIQIEMRWVGLVRRNLVVNRSDIVDVRRLRSLRELVPILSGTLPTLWGHFVPGRTVVIERRRSRFPLMITPPNPSEFISEAKSRGL